MCSTIVGMTTQHAASSRQKVAIGSAGALRACLQHAGRWGFKCSVVQIPEEEAEENRACCERSSLLCLRCRHRHCLELAQVELPLHTCKCMHVSEMTSCVLCLVHSLHISGTHALLTLGSDCTSNWSAGNAKVVEGPKV